MAGRVPSGHACKARSPGMGSGNCLLDFPLDRRGPDLPAGGDGFLCIRTCWYICTPWVRLSGDAAGLDLG
jgi:hypothetical protein